MANDFMVPWVEMIKPGLEEMLPGKMVLSQTPEDLHKNHNGDMHAAVIFTMLEMAGMGVLTMLLGDYAKDSFVVLKDIHINYDARAQGKITFTCELPDDQQLRILKAAKSGEAIEETVTAYAFDEEGTQVAHSPMTGVIRPKR